MLEKPDIQDPVIISQLEKSYGLRPAEITFLPLGADVNTAVYRVVTEDKTPYFLKLRSGVFDEATAAIPRFLVSAGVSSIIAPLETTDRLDRAIMGAYTLILYPYIEGKNGYQVELSEPQWMDFGAALKSIHAARLPAPILNLLPVETYSPHFREVVTDFQALIEESPFDDPVAGRLAALMLAKSDEITQIVQRADQLGRALQSRSLETVLCHSDIHPGNLLIHENNAVYIVDWDNPILAPKERDLMHIGMGGVWNNPKQEASFYKGYGQTEVDLIALAYYRYERIVEDFAAYCEQLLLRTDEGEDREQSFEYFASNFQPGNTIEAARKTDALIR